MTPTLTPLQIPLSDLDLHPHNVRAKSPETYEADNIAHLKASIAKIGLIQPLVVQKQGKGYGVLAGGRRLAALKALAADKAAKGVTSKTPIDCRVVPDDCDLTTTISLVENITQAAMTPLDEFEAFAAMMEVDGQSVQTIALTFNTTEAAVKERLRYGMVHPEIRAAARAKTLTLDAMKAFASHPSQDVQLEVYTALSREGDYLQAYEVRNALKSRGVQVSDALGAYVLEEYKAKDGPIAADLLEEHSVLEDLALAQEILLAKLHAAAEAERTRLGFAWADAAPTHSWEMFSDYGRVYPGQVEPDAAGQKRLDEITTRMEALEEQQNNEGISDEEYAAIEDEYDQLSEEADDLQTAYKPDDLARAGVVATWNNGVHLTVGLVRPEEKVADKKAAEGSKTQPDDDAITYPASLDADLKTERAMVLGAALASAPELACDLALFKLVADVLGSGTSVTYGFGIAASREYRSHNCLDEIDDQAGIVMAEREGQLSMGWADDKTSPADQFAAFRKLKPTEKAKLVAFAMAQTIKPSFARDDPATGLMAAVEAEALPDIRALWTPNAAFFNRLKKAQLLAILSKDLGLAQEAAGLGTAKKAEIVAFLGELFGKPFATLTDTQRAAIAAWCPPGMQTPEAKAATSKGKAPTKKAA